MATDDNTSQHRSIKEGLALATATLVAVASLLFPSSWNNAGPEVCHVAVIAAAVATGLFWVTRLAGPVAILLEWRASALFLAAMPFVYVIAWFEKQSAGGPTGWLALEIAGIPIYAGLANQGLRKSPMLLVFGIAAHGLLWDLWHLFTHTDYLPRWYALDCLVVDLSLSLYLGMRAPRWSA